jgi:hypothetical protein
VEPVTPPLPAPVPTLPASDRRQRRERRRVALLVAAIWFVTALPVVLGVTACPVARFLHTPCPGCGMTRAFELLLHGDVAASLAMHPLAIPTAFVQLAFAVVTILVSLRHSSPFVLWRTRIGRVSVYAAALVLVLDLVLWLARFAGAAHGPVPV